MMSNAATFVYGLLQVWIGAGALMALIYLRRHRGKLPEVFSGKAVEAVCLFVGVVGMLAGLGMIALAALR